MLNNLKSHLEKFDTKEHFFGAEFIENISSAECRDAYFIKVYDHEPLVLKKEWDFNESYFTLIDYLTTIKSQHVNGPMPEYVSSYYHDWLYYKRSYNIRKAWFYLTVHNEDDPDEVREMLIHILGRANCAAITSFFNIPNDEYRDHVINIMHYVGNTRAIRDLSMTYLDPKFGTQWQFHLWHLTPVTIIENFGYVFYLGNELSKIDYCPYDYDAKEYYYAQLYSNICKNLEKDIPKNRGITAERKMQIREEIDREVLNKSGSPCGFELDIDDDNDYSAVMDDECDIDSDFYLDADIE